MSIPGLLLAPLVILLAIGALKLMGAFAFEPLNLGNAPAEFEVATQCPECNHIASHRVDNTLGNLGAQSEQHAPGGW